MRKQLWCGGLEQEGDLRHEGGRDCLKYLVEVE